MEAKGFPLGVGGAANAALERFQLQVTDGQMHLEAPLAAESTVAFGTDKLAIHLMDGPDVRRKTTLVEETGWTVLTLVLLAQP